MIQKDQNQFRIKFWGTRGSLASPGAQCAKVGGNTVCIEVECGTQTIICDAGTGIRALGDMIMAQNKPRNLHMLLTHSHYDHIEGIPYFAPLFSKDYSLDIWCGKLEGIKNTSELFGGLMRQPFFPVGPEVFLAQTNFHQVGDNQAFDLTADIHITTMPLDHPGGATAYRIDHGGKSFAYVSDTEHQPGETNKAVVDFIKDADGFIYDASFSDAELPDYQGYGHSTWQEGLRLAKLAGVKKYFAFHHMPFRSDEELDEIEMEISGQMPGSGVAREGIEFIL